MRGITVLFVLFLASSLEPAFSKSKKPSCSLLKCKGMQRCVVVIEGDKPAETKCVDRSFGIGKVEIKCDANYCPFGYVCTRDYDKDTTCLKKIPATATQKPTPPTTTTTTSKSVFYVPRPKETLNPTLKKPTPPTTKSKAVFSVSMPKETLNPTLKKTTQKSTESKSTFYVPQPESETKKSKKVVNKNKKSSTL